MLKESILSYADDTTITSTGSTWAEVEVEMNEYLTVVSTWLALNQLSSNVTKTVQITFGIYYDSVPTNINIRIGNKYLKRVENCKYLGIYFDYNFK